LESRRVGGLSRPSYDASPTTGTAWSTHSRSRNPELHAAIIIAINTGLRHAELLGLTWDRVDRSRGVIRLEITKSGQRREVPLNDDSDRALVSLGPKAAGRVFQTRSIRTAFENAVEMAKLGDVTFHTLRRRRSQRESRAARGSSRGVLPCS
jgi:integrase